MGKYLDLVNQNKFDRAQSHASGNGEGPCQMCGGRLWCRLEESVETWLCRRCLGEEGNSWKELLYVPEEWKPIRSGAPTMSIRCPGCHRAVSTLLNQSPEGWRCSDCHRLSLPAQVRVLEP